MSENETYNPADNPWEPENAVVSSALNGVTGKVTAAEFIRKQGKKDVVTGEFSEYTVLRVVVEAANLEKPRELHIGCGDLRPSKDGATVDIQGPYFVGGKINKSSNLFIFVENLKAGGFPMPRFAKMGADALVGGLITWKAIERSFGKGKDRTTSTYDMPAGFVGFEGEIQQVAEDTGELKAQLAAEIAKVVKAADGGVLPRGQLSVKLAGFLKETSNKSAALGLLVNDEFLAGIDGVAYDKKTFTARA